MVVQSMKTSIPGYSRRADQRCTWGLFPFGVFWGTQEPRSSVHEAVPCVPCAVETSREAEW